MELLEQEPCEDCISRQAVLARIDEERKYLLELKMNGAEHIVVHHARRIIEDVPSIIQTPKTGHWIDMRCDQCGQVDISKPNYCPNCGAKMSESEVSE